MVDLRATVWSQSLLHQGVCFIATPCSLHRPTLLYRSQSLLHQGVCFILPGRIYEIPDGDTVSIPSSSGGVLHIVKNTTTQKRRSSLNPFFIRGCASSHGEVHNIVPSGNICLNPFFIRGCASWQQRDSDTCSTVPAPSQSLLHQGVCFIPAPELKLLCINKHVSIPSSSGGVLHCFVAFNKSIATELRLNPFFIRGCAS